MRVIRTWISCGVIILLSRYHFLRTELQLKPMQKRWKQNHLFLIHGSSWQVNYLTGHWQKILMERWKMPVKYHQLKLNLIVISVISKGMIPKHFILLKMKKKILASGLTGMVTCLNAYGFGRKGLLRWIFRGGGNAARLL